MYDRVIVWLSFLCFLLAGCGGNGEGRDADDTDGDGIPADGEDGAVDVPPDNVPDTETVDFDAVDDEGVDVPADPDAGEDVSIDIPGDEVVGPDLPRALAWVRANPMFISGIAISMGVPPEWVVNEYFDAFHANAVHLWENGLPREMDGWRAPGRRDMRFVSWVRHDGTSMYGGEVIGGYPADVPGRIGYQIGDEPRSWAELLEMEAGIDAVRAADPGALIILNFSCLADEIDEFLLYYCDTIHGDIFSYDYYTRSNTTYEILEIFRSAALACNRPYWRYMDAYENPGETGWHTESDIRWEAFIGLVYGYTGHTWFIYQIAPEHGLDPAFYQSVGDYSSPKTPRFAIAAQINVEMSNLGKSITQLTSTDVRYIPAIALTQPRRTTNWGPGAGGDFFITEITPVSGAPFQDILVGFFNDDFGERYFMVQNVNHTNAGWPVSSDAAATIRIGFDFSVVTDPGFDKTSLLSLNKLTGVVETLPLTPSVGDSATIEVTLAAGDTILLKYNTGADFAMQ